MINKITRSIIITCILICFFQGVIAVNSTPENFTYLTVVPLSGTIEIGDPLDIEGYIDDTIIGPYPGTLILIIRAPMSSQIDSYTSHTPNPDGSFSYSVITDVTGTWTVSARYGDESSAVSEVKVIPRETTKKTINTLNSYSAPTSTGDQVTMTGFLRDGLGVGISNKPVIFMVALPPYGCSICDMEDLLIWETYGTANTDSSGRYSLSFTPYDRGQYRVKTIFGGDETYQGASSSTRSIRAV